MIPRRADFYLSFVIPVFVLSVLALLGGVFEPQEMAAYDWLMRSRPAQPVNEEIVIIEISDDTLRELGQWPLRREFHAALIKALSESGCRAIIFDTLFSEPQAADDVLALEMERSGRVLLPCAFKLDQDKNGSGAAPAERLLAGVTDKLQAASAGIGHINIFIDSDGKVRRIPLWVRHKDRLWPSLGFLAAARRLGRGADKAAFNKMPFERQSSVWVNFPGPWTRTFRHFSYIDILKAYAARQNGTPGILDLSFFKDKICFVGLTAVGTVDLRANPFDTVYPVVGIQASICDSVLRGAFIARPKLALRAFIIALVFLCALFVCLRFTLPKALALCWALALVYAWLARVFFVTKGIFLDLFLPSVIIIIGYAGFLLRRFFLEIQRRKLLEKELEIAASIQRSFLPAALKDFPGVLANAALEPAKFVAGDFYDLIALNENTLGVFIGDVSGKGISAALIMAQAISLFRVLAQRVSDPAELLAALNSRLEPILKGRFVTGEYVIVHAKEGYWEGACAGHPSALFFDFENRVLLELLGASGPPLGIKKDVSYVTVRRQYKAADKMLLYTDGWIEERDRRGEEFGIERLKEKFLRASSEKTGMVLPNLLAEHDAFKGDLPLHDDLTAVVLEFTGP
ncbi:MAG: CHASE2 domain-containing protein [Candidatus Omnitrophica bacterium]|nr:CHASE2 domain-containing protein [Candidatus Omnitrophota bacterium]MDD5552522.1 CHASE2 domain-containing protein [Candidatus Omnitrophota bacterium]